MKEVYIVMVEDGNACCPGTVVEDVFATRFAADDYIRLKRIDEENVRKYSSLHRHIDAIEVRGAK